MKLFGSEWAPDTYLTPKLLESAEAENWAEIWHFITTTEKQKLTNQK